MKRNSKPDLNRELSKFVQKAKSGQLIDQLKSAKREEVLARLASLLKLAFQRGIESRRRNQELQQRWFRVCAYLAQVMARVVRDLEYEKLRTEVDDLKKQVFGKDVDSSRNTGHPA